MRSRRLALLLALLLWPSVVQAQSRVPADRPFSIAWDHDGANTTGYPVLIDGKQEMVVPVSALTSGTVTVELPIALSPGLHTVVVYAENEFNRVAGPELQVLATTPPPSPPTNPRVVIVVQGNADGTTVIRVEPSP